MSEVKRAERVLVTGAAGFIGYHLSKRLLDEGRIVCGLDCVNDYYDPTLKEARLRQLEGRPGWSFHRIQLEDGDAGADPCHGRDVVRVELGRRGWCLRVAGVRIEWDMCPRR